jgi:DNA-binding MarR family transcriptional regulator
MDSRSLSQRERRNLSQTWESIHAPQAHLNFWLELAAKSFAERLGPELKACRIIASEWAALRELYRPGRLSPLDLGRALGMTKGGASKLVDRLVQKGLVKKAVGMYDRRFRTVELTDKGRDLVSNLAFAELRMEHQFFGPLRFTGCRRLMNALKRTLGAQRRKYMDLWITLDGRGGQWNFQDAWRRSLRPRPLGNATGSGSEQSFELLVRQFAESPPGEVTIEREGTQSSSQHPADERPLPFEQLAHVLSTRAASNH